MTAREDFLTHVKSCGTCKKGFDRLCGTGLELYYKWRREDEKPPPTSA